MLDQKFQIQNWIIWDRIKGRGSKKNLVSTREDILWYCKGNKPTYTKIYSNIPKKTGGLGKKNGQDNRALTNVWYDISPIVRSSYAETITANGKMCNHLDKRRGYDSGFHNGFRDYRCSCNEAREKIYRN